jgi:hypothetical protein
VEFAPESSVSLAGETTPFAPNINGDLLGASRSLSFFYSRVTGPVVVAGSGSTTISNPKVADNNSPLPEDRLSFRYNHFHNALSVTGLGGPVIPAPGESFGIQQTATRDYDVESYTFSVEKTFFDRFMSVELRVPFRTTLASRLDLSAGSVTSAGPETDQFGNPILQVNPTLANTLGREDTEWDNLSMILKAALYRSRGLTVSAGSGVGIPTARDTHVRVTDFLGTVRPPNVFEASIQRIRDIEVNNSTWSLSPFFAAVTTPTERFFAQGFLQFDFPLNSSKITYRNLTNANGFVLSDRATGATIFPPPPGIKYPPFAETARIDEQILLHLDVGTGYWILRNPGARWLTGIAPTLELHYTTSLENPNVVRLSSDPAGRAFDPAGRPLPPGTLIIEPGPQVGSRRGNVDIVDLTVGTTFEFADRATLATAFAFPLQSGKNKVFDWEFLLQLNYYFGGPRSRVPSF